MDLIYPLEFVIYYGSQTKFVRHIVFAPFLIIILITSLRLLSGDVLLFYVSFSLLLLFFHKFLSALFLGDALIKLYETL
jgi:hypothetical protein